MNCYECKKSVDTQNFVIHKDRGIKKIYCEACYFTRFKIKVNKRTVLQCGYEDTCLMRYCKFCPRHVMLGKQRITLAEAIVIEDFAECDIEHWMREKPADFKLSQDIMLKLMKRMRWIK